MSQHVEININAVGDPPAFPELEGLVDIEGELTHAVILEKGTTSGKASLVFYIELPSGRYVMAQTTAAILLLLAGATQGAIERFDEHR